VAGSNQKSTFAFIFSDLMAGAMAVIIVLLIFLQVVATRGTGTNNEIDQVVLPPGFNTHSGAPMVKIRALICGDQSAQIKFEWRNNEFRKYEMTAPDNCTLSLLLFDTGLHKKVLHFVADAAIDSKLTMDVVLTVSGYSVHRTPPTHNFRVNKGDTLIGVSLSHPRIVYEY